MATEFLDDPWDDTLLIKAYDDSIKLAREELARRIALSTSKVAKEDNSKANSEVMETPQEVYKIGDYVRATYEDGIDYEAKIMSIDSNAGTCVLKYIGYDNEQEVHLSDVISSWGKKSRRLQFAKAKSDSAGVMNMSKCKTSKKDKAAFNLNTIPPPPPMPPMLTATQNGEDSEHLSAMLMSWYMSGYYTGVYQGMAMAKLASKGKKE